MPKKAKAAKAAKPPAKASPKARSKALSKTPAKKAAKKPAKASAKTPSKAASKKAPKAPKAAKAPEPTPTPPTPKPRTKVKKSPYDKAKENLEQMKADVLSEIQDDLRKGREGNKDEGRDAYDVASEERDREISMLLGDRDRAKLQAIEEALERIDDGTYGTCDACEGEIHPERLAAMPFTRLCVQCQADLENEARQMRRPEDSAAFRRLGSFDYDETEG